MKTCILGHTTQGIPILAYDFGSNGNRVLILGGVHGDEYEGVLATLFLLKNFKSSFNFNLRITLVPILNIDGLLLKQRKNAKNVDLNRNLPTKDWTKKYSKEKYFPGSKPNSEPENQALVQWIENQNDIVLIVSWHSWHPLLNTNGDCIKEARKIAEFTQYKITDDIGYPTPGSLGTYTGLEKGIPTLTYELKREISANEVSKKHIPAFLEALKITEKKKI